LSSLSKLQTYQQRFSAEFKDDPAVVPGELLTQLGLLLGSGSRMGPAGLYLEPALTGVSAGMRQRASWVARGRGGEGVVWYACTGGDEGRGGVKGVW
jgi:hypothetical protein